MMTQREAMKIYINQLTRSTSELREAAIVLNAIKYHRCAADLTWLADWQDKQRAKALYQSNPTLSLGDVTPVGTQYELRV